MEQQKQHSVSAEQRHLMISEAAFFRAERSGFRSDPLGDWLEAEAEIDAMLQNTPPAPHHNAKKSKSGHAAAAKAG